MAEPRDRPILFSGPMVRAILDGSKTQTRRIVKPQLIGSPWYWEGDYVDPTPGWFDAYEAGEEPCGARTRNVDQSIRDAYGVPSDRLWVRETWQMKTPPSGAIYRADDISGHIDGGWRPSIFMPRWACRIILEVTKIRIERLQEITEEDILAEGVTVDRVAERTGASWSSMPTLHDAWRVGWDSINGKRAPWASDPWVWAIDFKRVANA